MLANLADGRVHTGLTRCAGHGHAVRLDRLVQPLDLIEQPAHLAQ